MTLTDWRQLHGDQFAGIRALVTGGAGFIGSHIAEALSALGASVVVLDNLISGHRKNLDHLSGIELIEGSVLDVDAVNRAARGCRFIYHQAAAASVFQSLENPALYHDVNGRGALNVLEAARRENVHRTLFAASSSAYGDSEVLPKVETMPALPR